MTQPPIPPPNNGWQQPPAGPPPGYGQGPAYGQPAYGPGSAYGQPGYGPGGPGYGPGGPGYGGPGGPRRGRGLLIAGIAVAAVLVVGVVAALVLPGLLRDEPASSPAPVSQPSVPATPTSPARRFDEASALATKFLTYLNANDQKHAAALGCEDTKKLLPGVILLSVDPPTKLTVSGPAAQMSDTYSDPYYQMLLSVPFTGTTKSNPATGMVMIMDVPNQPICVRLMKLELG